MTAVSTSGTRRVLVVELAADISFGHFPVAFAELATELASLGCEVEAFTRRGWHFDGDAGFAPLTVHRFGPRAELAFRWGARLEHLPARARLPLGTIGAHRRQRHCHPLTTASRPPLAPVTIPFIAARTSSRPPRSRGTGPRAARPRRAPRGLGEPGRRDRCGDDRRLLRRLPVG